MVLILIRYLGALRPMVRSKKINKKFKEGKILNEMCKNLYRGSRWSRVPSIFRGAIDRIISLLLQKFRNLTSNVLRERFHMNDIYCTSLFGGSALLKLH